MQLQKSLLFLLLLLLLSSCGSRKMVADAPPPYLRKSAAETSPAAVHPLSEEGSIPDEIETGVIDQALEFLGTTYRYGGTSREGMDCSGLIYTAFLLQDITLPRTSRDMAREGKQLALEEVEIGDLLFFITSKKKKTINHVGLVVQLTGEVIHFIHSTTSAGVIISTLDESYWQEHFVMARRIL